MRGISVMFCIDVTTLKLFEESEETTRRDKRRRR